jgi:integrase
MGLGAISAVGLSDARIAAGEARKLLHAGIDPIEDKKGQADRARLESARSVTFKACAEAYVKAHAPGWRNPKHANQWRNTLATYAFPVFGDLLVQSIDTDLVQRVLEPIWTSKTETAGRLRGRIEAVLDWAAARKYRTGENPARWRGHLDKLLPAKSKVQKIEHHPALPYADVGSFIAKLRERDGTAARALEFAILTAARTSEVLNARWDEVDLGAKVWTIPAARMKAGREHRVPLSSAAVAVLKSVHVEGAELVFPGAKKGNPLSNMALLKLLDRMGRSDLTTHGFRSSFRDWAAERTNFPREVAEAALAHVIRDKTEAAYRRSDLFDRRRKLMEAWASHCTTVKSTAGATVVSLKRGGRTNAVRAS